MHTDIWVQRVNLDVKSEFLISMASLPEWDASS